MALNARSEKCDETSSNPAVLTGCSDKVRCASRALVLGRTMGAARELTAERVRGTRHPADFDVVQYVRAPVSIYHFRREPWPRNRLCGGWLPAADSADRGRHPDLFGSPASGTIALHDAAAGA